LFRDDAYLRASTGRVLRVGDRGIELDRTIFYPAGGGQPGDTGTLMRANGERISITDTRKSDETGGVLHVPTGGANSLAAGEAVTMEIDWARRYTLMRVHTALHVMSCVVVAPVTGGNIAMDKGEFGQADAAAAQNLLQTFDKVFAVLENNDAQKLQALGYAQ